MSPRVVGPSVKVQQSTPIVLVLALGLITACGGAVSGSGAPAPRSSSSAPRTATAAPGEQATGPAQPGDPGPRTFPPIELPTPVPSSTFDGPQTAPPIELPPVEFPPATFEAPPTFPLPSGVELPPDARQPLRLRPVAVWDPAAGNIPAMTFLLPDGWQAEGNVLWTHQWSRLAQLQTRIVDPTGIQIEWLPLQDFMWFQPPAGFDVPIGSNYQGKAFVPPVTDPAEFVSAFWMPNSLAHLQGATLMRIDEVPAVAEEFVRGFGGPATASAYRLRYEYSFEGQAWEEDVFLALLYAGSAEITSWYVNFAYTVRAPKGVLDQEQEIISTVIASRVTTPEWEGTYRLVQQLFTQGIVQQMADTAAFGRALTQYYAESAALRDQVAAERQASQDRIARLRGEVLSGVQTYVDPVSQQLVQLPVGWNEYWVNSQGEYLVSDTAGFDPNDVDNGGWQRLQPSDI